MTAQRISVIGPDGTPREAEDVPILESTERNSEVKLEDGTILYIKAAPISVMKVIGLWDAFNNPTYSVQSNTVIGIKYCPPEHKKGEQNE